MNTQPAARSGSSSPRRGRISWTIGRRLAAGYAAALALMAVIGVVSFTNTASLVTNSEWVEHTHEVLAETDAVLSSLKDAEAGQRGYLITGVDAYLEPYTAAQSSVDDHLAAVRDLTSDNPVQ